MAARNPGGSATTKKPSAGTEGTLRGDAHSVAKATVLTAAGALVGHSTEVAKELAEMQRKYIENLNFDAVEVACISALDRGPASKELTDAAVQYANVESKKDAAAIARAQVNLMSAAREAGLTGLGAYCLTDLLPRIQMAKAKLVEQLVERATLQRLREQDHATFDTLAADLVKQAQTLRTLIDAYGNLPEAAKATPMGTTPPAPASATK